MFYYINLELVQKEKGGKAMKKTKWSLLALLFTMLLVLAACNDDDKKDGDEKTVEEEAKALFDLSVENKGDAIDGGILQVAMVKDEKFKGIFLQEFADDAYDSDLMDWASNSLFETDENFMITDEGIASLEVDQENKKAVIKIRENVKWSDGQPLTIDDVIYPYLIIGHPDYDGVRNDTQFQNIIGAVEYTEGKADTISGIKKLDEHSIEISFKEVSPSIFYGGDGIWGYAAPKHQIGDIPVAELEEHDAVRKNPVTLGAFKFDKIVPGESVQYVKNEHYWKGEPKLDGVLAQVVPSASISVAIGTGKYDLIQNFNATKINEIKELKNIKILGRPELYYSYLGFKVGKYDTKQGLNITDFENSKMGDVKLRQAIGYALDVEEVSKTFYNNLRERANSLIPPVFAAFYNPDLKGYTYDKEKAISLLEEAGYKDVNGDGVREDKNGEKFTINLAAMSGDSTQEEIIAYYLQNLKDVGLDVQLSTGRLIEINTFYKMVENDDKSIDMFMGAWSTGTNPSPAGLYGSVDSYNFSRYTSDLLETTVKNIDSAKSFDTEFRAEQFKIFQEHIEEVATTIPLNFRYEIVPVNNRVKNYNIDYADETEIHEIELVAEEPVAN